MDVNLNAAHNERVNLREPCSVLEEQIKGPPESFPGEMILSGELEDQGQGKRLLAYWEQEVKGFTDGQATKVGVTDFWRMGDTRIGGRLG